MQPSSSQIKKHFAWSRRMKPFSKEICDQTKDKGPVKIYAQNCLQAPAE